jgi:hypothetical protein
MAFAATSGAMAVTYDWDGSVSGGWGAVGNWTENTVTFGNTTDLVFYTTGGNLDTFLGTAGRTIRSLTFNDNADSNVNIRLSTTATSTTGVNLTFDTDSGDATISVAAGSDGFHTIGTGGQLGSIVLNDNLVIDMNGSRVLQFGRIVTGAQSITKNGTGELRFANATNGTYTYSGGFIMDGGSVRTFNSPLLVPAP